MKRYIRASSEQDDIEFFNLPVAYCNRLKKYIIDNNPELLPREVYSGEAYNDEDFLNSLNSLQLVFDSTSDLYYYVMDAVIYSPVDDPDAKNLKPILERYETNYKDIGIDDADYMQQSNYVVSGLDPLTGEEPFSPIDTDDAKSAITSWFKMSEKYPSCICICGKDYSAAKQLLRWVIDNEDQFIALYNRYKNPYKLDFLLDYCKQNVNSGHLLDWSGDQIDPFSLG